VDVIIMSDAGKPLSTAESASSNPVWNKTPPPVVGVEVSDDVVALVSAATVMERTLCAIWLASSVAWVVKVKVPLWLGVPAIVPFA